MAKDAFLVIKDLTKIYNPHTPGEVRAMNSLDLTMTEGEFITIVGSNAAGKTTLFNLLAGSFLPTRGDILLEGKSIVSLPEHKRARSIARVRQNPNDSLIPSMTLAENLSLAKLIGHRLTLRTGVKPIWWEEFARLVQPLGIGLERRLNDKTDLLSGGQKQAVALLMVTLTKPKLLLLDEHTAALDPKMSKKILAITKDIVEKNRLTTLMITHNIHQALEYGTRVILLNQGAIGFEAKGKAKKRLTITDIVEKIEGRTTELEKNREVGKGR